MKNTSFTFLLLAVLLLANAAFGPSLQRSVQSVRAVYSAGNTDAALEARNENAFALILGNVRTSAADFMYVQTENYLHDGVGYRPHLKLDSTNEHEHFASCETGGVPTLIRGKPDDFRGFLGDIEREVKPYLDASKPHLHGAGNELMPWFRLMTLSNPQYVRGYRVGAYTLMTDGKWQEAVDFLNEGIERNKDNPDLFRLYQTLAQIHLHGRTAKDYPWGKAWVQNAYEAARKAYELGLKQRPPLGEVGKQRDKLVWNLDLEEDFLFAACNLVTLLDERGKLDEALKTAREIRDQAPTHAPLLRTLDKLQAKKAQQQTPQP
jgi:tetratricopeptide (TPR) repeat protein